MKTWGSKLSPFLNLLTSLLVLDVINSDPNQPSEIVEFTTGGQFVAEIPVDPNQGGSFGLAVKANGQTAKFAAVDDNTATLLIWTIER